VKPDNRRLLLVKVAFEACWASQWLAADQIFAVWTVIGWRRRILLFQFDRAKDLNLLSLLLRLRWLSWVIRRHNDS
jgi:hypothetical protein